MRRILIVANTFYQVIVALQLRCTIFKSDEVVLLLTDHSIGAKAVASKLETEKIFTQVVYIETKDLIKKRQGLRTRIRDFFQFTFSDTNRYSYILKDVNGLFFDEIIAYNWSSDLYGLYFILSTLNRKIKVSRFEEGLLSYDNEVYDGKKKYIGSIRHLFGKSYIMDAAYKYYCFYPQLYSGCFSAFQIPLIDRKSHVVDILRRVFSVSERSLKYCEKYIFFSSVYDFEGGYPIGEFDVVEQIAKVVGKNNLLIKKHPRDGRSIYEDNGYKVDKNSSIPWEVIQLTGNFADKIFLTSTSGSVLLGNLIGEYVVKTYFVYKCCNIARNSVALHTVQSIEKVLSSSFITEKSKGVMSISNVESIVE